MWNFKLKLEQVPQIESCPPKDVKVLGFLFWRQVANPQGNQLSGSSEDLAQNLYEGKDIVL